MSGCFNFSRWLISILLILILFLVFFIVTPYASLSYNLTNKDTVKTWLKSSGIYNNLISSTLDLVLLGTEDTPEIATLVRDLKDTNTEMGALVAEIASHKHVEEISNTLLDSFYEWFAGKTERPEFNIPIAKDKEQFVRMITVLFKLKYNALPLCEGVAVQSEDFNPLETECRYEGVTDQVVIDFINQNASKPELDNIWQSASFNSDSLNIDQQTSNNFQLNYKIMTWAPLVTVMAIIGLNLVLVITIPKIKRSILILAIINTISGVIMLVLALISRFFLPFIENAIFNSIPELNSIAIQENINKILQYASNDISNVMLVFSIGVLTLGLILIVIRILIRKM